MTGFCNQNSSKRKRHIANALVEMLVEPAEVHYPPYCVSEMLDDMVEETESRMQRERQMSLEDALRLKVERLSNSAKN